jgi:hypothetical protein
MESNSFENKENLPPGLKKALASREVQKRKNKLGVNEKVKVLRESIQLKHSNWQAKRNYITEMLTTPK